MKYVDKERAITNKIEENFLHYGTIGEVSKAVRKTYSYKEDILHMPWEFIVTQYFNTHTLLAIGEVALKTKPKYRQIVERKTYKYLLGSTKI